MDQKIENQLNLAINIPEDERVRTQDLDTGYNMTENEWELIVKYNGNIETAAMNIADSLKILLGGYALVKIKQERIDEFAALREVIYIEKPKKLYFELENSGSVSCLDFQYTDSALDGSGVITAIIDSSVDYRHPDFMTEEGKTRIIELYDENTGRVYSEDDINAAIDGDLSRVPVEDVSGHGTHVAGIAAGNGRASNGRYRGVAYKSRLLIVKLGNDLYFSSARLMEALDYVIRKAASLSMPVAINMSFGNNYGAHDGTSLLETYINAVADIWQCVIVAGSGNEAARKIHVMHDFAKTAAPVISTELVIGRYEPSIDIQIWKNYADIYRITLTAPDGRRYGPVQGDDVITVFRAGSTEIYVYFGQPSPYSVNQEIFIQMIGADYISSGIWIIEAEALDVRDGIYHMWLPAGNFVSSDTGFTKSSPDVTLTIPSTSYNVITVGAYNGRTGSYADFSGRGYTRVIRTVKPDIVAPGVNIMSPAPGGGYSVQSGTSMAAPFVTGTAAHLMQWGIVKGMDPYMYGAKIKAQLIRGAVPLRSVPVPSERAGWGALCVRKSIPD